MKILVKCLAFLFIFSFAATKSYSQLGISFGVSITLAPPELPVYVQPECPNDGFIWTPGYWAYGPYGYYWVPGVWVLAPQPGYLWTPSYWGFENGNYGYHAGYWGLHIGFYGGVNYGYGYGGHGYGGGQWQGGHFQYNTAVSTVNVTVIHNTYIDKTVIVNNVSHTSFNGPGGVTEKPRPEEQVAMKEHHIEPTKEQTSHETVMSQDKNQRASVNGGKPAVTAMDKVGGKTFGVKGKEVPKPATMKKAEATVKASPNKTTVNKTPPKTATTEKPKAVTKEQTKTEPNKTAVTKPVAKPVTKPNTTTQPAKSTTPAHSTQPKPANPSVHQAPKPATPKPTPPKPAPAKPATQPKPTEKPKNK